MTVRIATEGVRSLDGRKGLAMKIEDGSAVLVPGGETAMEAHAVAARRAKLEANAHDPNYKLVMQTGSNLTASAISRAIRADRPGIGVPTALV